MDRKACVHLKNLLDRKVYLDFELLHGNRVVGEGCDATVEADRLAYQYDFHSALAPHEEWTFRLPFDDALVTGDTQAIVVKVYADTGQCVAGQCYFRQKVAALHYNMQADGTIASRFRQIYRYPYGSIPITKWSLQRIKEKYGNVVVVFGGQNSNSIFSELVNRDVFRPITSSDKGKVVVQVGTTNMLGTNWCFYGIAGYTAFETRLAAEWVAVNGLPSDNIEFDLPPMPRIDDLDVDYWYEKSNVVAYRVWVAIEYDGDTVVNVRPAGKDSVPSGWGYVEFPLTEIEPGGYYWIASTKVRHALANQTHTFEIRLGCDYRFAGRGLSQGSSESYFESECMQIWIVDQKTFSFHF